jgi:methionyl-tRNA formyltransferase
MTSVSRLALFVSHHAGHAVLGEALGMPGALRVVLVATDDPERPCCNTPARLWRHGWDEDLRQLVPRLAAEAGLDAFTGSVRRPGGEFHRRFEAARPDALLAAVFGQRIPAHLLEQVEGRAWNIHPVVPGLPLAATRGSRPFEIAYELGAREIQLCLHRMTEAFDDGEELARSEPLPLPPAREPGPELLLELQRRTAPLSAALVRRSLPTLLAH